MKTETLPIELPRIDADTQSRIKINDDTVSDYADLIEASDGEWPFPPIDVFHDGTDHHVGDGFHRLLGALRTKRGSIPCRIHTGTSKDARIFGMTANDKHALRMSHADKRSNIEWLLDNGGKMTQADIADAAGVSVRTVRKVVADRKYPASAPEKPPKADRQPSGTTAGGGGSEPVADTPEKTPKPPKGNGKPPKQFDRSSWMKQWGQNMGPLVRLVDKIADNVGESGCDSKKVVHDHLNVATEEMQEWMGVEK